MAEIFLNSLDVRDFPGFFIQEYSQDQQQIYQRAAFGLDQVAINGNPEKTQNHRADFLKVVRSCNLPTPHHD
jgi:hypothetical protein